MEVAIADHGLVRHGDQRVVVGGFSSTVTASRVAATYSRSAPWTCGTTRNERASCTDAHAPGSKRPLPYISSRM